MTTVIQELSAKFNISENGFLKGILRIEDTLDNLPKATEKATERMNKGFERATEHLEDFDKRLAASGKDFDTKNVQKALQQAQKEFKETGNVTKDTMTSLNKEINSVEWKSLDSNSRLAFKNVKAGAESMERQMKKLNDINFLEQLPEDAKEAGKAVVRLEGNLEKAQKKIKSLDDGADLNQLQKEVQTARKELEKTGSIAESTMKSITTSADRVNLDGLSEKAAKEFGKVKSEAENLDRTIDNIGKGSKGMSGLSDDTVDVTNKVGGLKGAIKGLGPMLAASLGGVAISGFAKSIVDATAEVKALNSQYEQVMGDMKGTTDKYLGEMAEKYNVHPNELKKSMLQYQAILKSKGLSEQDAYETSKMWLERTVDGSSFANESIEESTGRMMGIIKGEYDSADTVMINLSQTMMNDKAQEVYGKKWDELSVKQQEQLKVQESIRQHTSAGVLGQGIKEADSYEKNVAQLKNTWKDFLGTYGGPALDVANNALKGGISVIKGIEGGFKRIKQLINELSSGKPVNLMMKLGFSNGEADNIINWFNTLKQQLSIAGGAVRDFVSQGLGKIKAFFSGPDGQQLLAAVKNIFGGIVTIVKFYFPLAKAIIVSIWNNIVGVIKGGFQILKGLLQVFSGLFTGDFRKMWEGVKNIFFGAIKLVWNYVQLMFFGKLLKGGVSFIKLFAGRLKTMWSNILSFFKSFGASIVKNTSAAFRSLGSGIIKIFGSSVKWLKNSASGLAKSVIGFFKSLGSGSLKMMSNLKSGLAKSWSSIKSNAYNAGKFIKDKTVGAFRDTWNGIKGWIGKIKDGVVGMKNSVSDSAVRMKNALKDKVIGGLNLMIDGVNWVAGKIGMDKPLNHINPNKYSTGTGATTADEMAIVGDRGPGNGPNGFRNELIKYPNGQMELSPDKDTLRFLPRGTVVFNGQQTYGILSQMNDKEPGAGGPIDWIKDKVKSGLSNALFSTIGTANKVIGSKKTGQALSYAANKGESIKKTAFDIWDYASNPGKLMNLALDRFGVDFSGIKGVPGDIMGALFGKLKTGISNKFKSWFDSSGGAVAGILDPNLINYFFGHTDAYTRETDRWWHEGVDFPFVYQNVKTPMGGTLTRQPFMPGGYGNWVTVDNGATRLIFGHLRDYGRSPASGTRVKPGDTVGISGNSGFSTGPHLHFGVKQNGQDINPLPWLRNARKRSKGTGAKLKRYASGTANSYRIKWGDTLSGIAMRYGTTVAALKKLNNLRSDMIYAGRTLKLPGSSSKTASKSTLPKATTRIGSLNSIAGTLNSKAKSTPFSTLSKNYTGIASLITNATKTAKTDSVDTVYKNTQAVVKKIDSTILANQKKLNANLAKIKKGGNSKTALANLRAENNAINSQIKYLQSVKKNELLKGDVLKKLVAKRADLEKALKDAQERSKVLKEEKSSFKGSLSESMMGYAGFGAAKGNTARDFVAFMKYRLGQVKKFGANVRKLVTMGIDRNILKDILNEGMESAMPKVAMLVSGGKGYIGQINKLQADIQKEVSKLAGDEAGYVYNKGITAASNTAKAKETTIKAVDKQKTTYVSAKKPVAKAPVKKSVKKPATKAVKVASYLIKWGDTLGTIAQKFHTSVANLKKMNGLKSDMIYAGKKLKVPGYATGGIVNIPQLAWIAEGGFAESIISHDPARRTSQERIWQQTGEQLGFNSMSESELNRVIAVLMDIRDSNNHIANRDMTMVMNGKEVGRQVAGEVHDQIVQTLQYKNRGLSRGR